MAKQQSSVRAATPATAALTRLGIAFEVRAYSHDPSSTDFGREAAELLGASPERVFKTLLADANGRLIVGIVPVAGKLDLKSLAASVGARKASMADPSLAERKTGYVVGGISPFGQRTQLPTVLDTSAMNFETILVSGGRRGLDLELSPQELLRATRGAIASIAGARGK